MEMILTNDVSNDEEISFYARIRKHNRITIPIDVVTANREKLMEGSTVRVIIRGID